MTVSFSDVRTCSHCSRFWRKALLLGLTLAVAGCGGLYRQNASQWADFPNEPGTVSVMSFNVRVGGQPADAALDAIADASPDLVCLQEVTRAFAGHFEQRLAAAYPYRVFVPGPTIQGIGIASRFPITDANLLELDLPHLPAVAATVRPDAGPVHVACVHFVTPFARFGPQAGLMERYYRHRKMRVGQARALLQHIDSVDMPAIVLGDMNEWEGQAALAVFADAGFRNACHARGSRCTATWPGRAVIGPAIFRIDHILGRGVDFRPAAVLNSGGSDHYPVVARFALGAAVP